MRLDPYLPVLVIFAVTTWTHAEICNDVDSTVCREIWKSRPNLCNDSCTRNICKKFCGICPITCYNCTEIGRPEDCRKTKVCSHDQSCIVTQTVTTSFEIAYDLNCADNKLCMDFYNHGSTRKRSIDLYGGCCSSDLCNKRVPSGNQIQQTSMQVAGTMGTTTQNKTVSPNNTCSDVSQSVCQKLISSSHSACSDDCTAKLCPNSCNKCLRCYKCDFLGINDVDKCNRTDICSPGEECSISKIISSTSTPGYTFGCSSTQNIETYQTVLVEEVNDLKNGLSSTITKCIPNLSISGFIGDVHLVSHGKVFNEALTCPLPQVTRRLQQALQYEQYCKKCHLLHRQRHDVSHSNASITPAGSCCNGSYCNDKTFAQKTVSVSTSTTKMPSVCDHNPCLNGATCYDRHGSVRCHCSHGFRGHKCEEGCNTCHHGSCHNLTHTSLCSCPRGYRGSDCSRNCHEHFETEHCPPDFVRIPGLQNCYFFDFHPRRTWDEARERCQRYHCSNLTIIDNDDEEGKISLYIQNNLHHFHIDENEHNINTGAYFWLDGRRKDAGYDWFWSSSGEKISYHKWHPGTPDDSHNYEDCIAYGPAEGFKISHPHRHIYYWNDRSCSHQLFTFCEYVNNPKP